MIFQIFSLSGHVRDSGDGPFGVAEMHTEFRLNFQICERDFFSVLDFCLLVAVVYQNVVFMHNSALFPRYFFLYGAQRAANSLFSSRLVSCFWMGHGDCSLASGRLKSFLSAGTARPFR